MKTTYIGLVKAKSSIWVEIVSNNKLQLYHSPTCMITHTAQHNIDISITRTIVYIYRFIFWTTHSHIPANHIGLRLVVFLVQRVPLQLMTIQSNGVRPMVSTYFLTALELKRDRWFRYKKRIHQYFLYQMLCFHRRSVSSYSIAWVFNDLSLNVVLFPQSYCVIYISSNQNLTKQFLRLNLFEARLLRYISVSTKHMCPYVLIHVFSLWNVYW